MNDAKIRPDFICVVRCTKFRGYFCLICLLPRALASNSRTSSALLLWADACAGGLKMVVASRDASKGPFSLTTYAYIEFLGLFVRFFKLTNWTEEMHARIRKTYRLIDVICIFRSICKGKLLLISWNRAEKYAKIYSRRKVSLWRNWKYFEWLIKLTHCSYLIQKKIIIIIETRNFFHNFRVYHRSITILLCAFNDLVQNYDLLCNHDWQCI